MSQTISSTMIKSGANTPTFNSHFQMNSVEFDDKPFDKSTIEQILHALVRIVIASNETVTF